MLKIQDKEKLYYSLLAVTFITIHIRKFSSIQIQSFLKLFQNSQLPKQHPDKEFSSARVSMSKKFKLAKPAASWSVLVSRQSAEPASAEKRWDFSKNPASRETPERAHTKASKLSSGQAQLHTKKKAN